MANYLGGDIIEIVCQHPTLGEFRFAPKANESFTFDLGGIRANDDTSQITGAGEAIYQMNRVRWMFEGPVAIDFLSGNEMENLPKLSSDAEQGIWTISNIGGNIWKGKGRPVGDLQQDTNAATMTLKVSGSGKLEKL